MGVYFGKATNGVLVKSRFANAIRKVDDPTNTHPDEETLKMI